MASRHTLLFTLAGAEHVVRRPLRRPGWFPLFLRGGSRFPLVLPPRLPSRLRLGCLGPPHLVDASPCQLGLERILVACPEGFQDRDIRRALDLAPDTLGLARLRLRRRR